MTKIQIPYGSIKIDLDIEAEQLDIEEGSRNENNTKDSTVVRQALRNPIGTKQLREIVKMKEQGGIVIVVDDQTRAAPTEKMLDGLTEEIGEEHRDRITLLVACGTHEAPAEADLQRILGKYFEFYNIKIHDCDARDLVHVGTTKRGTPVLLNRDYVDACVKILTGDITLHYYAGFGGGRKSILPGISSREAIKRNHALLVDEHAVTANIKTNPVHLDMSEAASFAPPDFVLNTIADSYGNLVDAYAGELSSVFLKGAGVAEDMFCLETDGLFDVLIVSTGGFPKDRNLYQATKAIQNCYTALVPGGKLILVAECRDGIGDRYFEEWMDKYRSFESAEAAIKTDFVLGGHKAYYMRKTMERVRLSIVSELDTNTLTRWGLSPYTSVAEAIEGEIGYSKLDDAGAGIKNKLKIGILRNGLDTLLVPG